MPRWRYRWLNIKLPLPNSTFFRSRSREVATSPNRTPGSLSGSFLSEYPNGVLS